MTTKLVTHNNLVCIRKTLHSFWYALHDATIVCPLLIEVAQPQPQTGAKTTQSAAKNLVTCKHLLVLGLNRWPPYVLQEKSWDLQATLAGDFVRMLCGAQLICNQTMTMLDRTCSKTFCDCVIKSATCMFAQHKSISTDFSLYNVTGCRAQVGAEPCLTLSSTLQTRMGGSWGITSALKEMTRKCAWSGNSC